MTIPAATIQAITEAVGAAQVITEPADLEPYLVEERDRLRGACDLVARPGSTAEVAAVVSACWQADVAIVPLGGRTGLTGGGIADGGVVLSTERMNKVREIDALNHTITVDAGCVLADIQARALEADCLFPLSLAAEGSCQIGGNISTNAGGTGVLRYGNMRNLVLGLEVVLPDGRVWDGLVGLRKDNTGYDLKQLFIGAEGTLGVITGAVLALFPAPRTTVTAMIGIAGIPLIMETFSRIRRVAGDRLTAFEAFSRRCLDFCLTHMDSVGDPFAQTHAHYVLLELTSPRENEGLRAELEDVLGLALEDGIIEDAVFADSGTQARALWDIRETIPEAQKFEGESIKHDVSVPVSKIAEFLVATSARLEADFPNVRIVAFGHIGDGNIHFNISQPEGADGPAFAAETGRINRIVHDAVVTLGGSISAEHGIGIFKLDELRHYKSEVEMDLMRSLKKAIDGKNLMNPGKIFEF